MLVGALLVLCKADQVVVGREIRGLVGSKPAGFGLGRGREWSITTRAVGRWPELLHSFSVLVQFSFSFFSVRSKFAEIVSSPHPETRPPGSRWSQGSNRPRRHLMSAAAAKIEEETVGSLVANLTDTQAGLWLILHMQI